MNRPLVIENPMVNRPIPYQRPEKSVCVEDMCCECNYVARIRINGKKYCLDCAECEGVELIG